MAPQVAGCGAKSGADFGIEFLSAVVGHYSMVVTMAAPVLIHGHHTGLYTCSRL